MVVSPCCTTPIAPPGCECQPELPPGWTVIWLTTISLPCSRGRLPCDMYVPRASSWPLKSLGGVATPGTAFMVRKRAANPTVNTPSRVTRLVILLIGISYPPVRPRHGASATRRHQMVFSASPASAGTDSELRRRLALGGIDRLSRSRGAVTVRALG